MRRNLIQRTSSRRVHAGATAAAVALVLLIGAGGWTTRAVASPADGAVLPADRSVTFDVPAGSGWSYVWGSRLLITPGAASGIANAWGSWGFLDHVWLRDRLTDVVADAAARGGVGLAGEQERARRLFYSSGLERDQDRQSLFGPTFKIVAYGYEPTETVWFVPGTYTWQVRYISSWNYPAESAVEYTTAPKSFTITSPPVVTPPAPTPIPAKATTRAPAKATTPTTATATPTPSCTTQQQALRAAGKRLTHIRRQLAAANGAAASKRLTAQRKAAQKVQSKAKARLKACQHP